MSIQIKQFRKFEKNTLQGFLTIFLDNIGLEIRDCSLHKKDGKQWIGLPSKPYEKDDGTQGWSYIVKFSDKDKWHQFQEASLKALDRYLREN